MGLCGWIVFGFFAGLLARALMPGKQSLGLIMTTVLGVAGSFVGGGLASVVSGHGWRGLHPSGFVGAVVGAFVLLLVGEMMGGRRRR